MQLDSIAKFKAAFYRLVGAVEADDALVENGEAVGDVALLCLTEGAWRAQQFLCDLGMSDHWRVRSSALVWTGTDLTLGGRYSALPTDFLRLSKSDERSSLVEANGDGWGQLMDELDDMKRGAAYYLKDGQLWLCRDASPPTMLYVDYIQRLPEITGASDLDPVTGTAFRFPVDVRGLIPSMAAGVAADEAWLPVDDSGYSKIFARIAREKDNARDVARRDRRPRLRRPAETFGTHYPFI